MTIRFKGAIPILRVADVHASRDYYVDKLGFTVDWDAGGMISLTRDGCSVMLTQWAQGRRGTWVWVGVSDAAVVHEDLVARGARVRFPPTNYEWAYELQVEDLDGNVLRLGSSPRPDEPYGAFLDGAGDLWSTVTNEKLET